MGGEHEKVWQELTELGSTVREDPNAADAMAVAYETMQRVEANIRTIAGRLREIGYTFRTEVFSQKDDWLKRAEGAMNIASKFTQSSTTSPHVQSMLAMMNEMMGKVAAQTAKAKKSTACDAAVRARVPPSSNARKQIARLEKAAGVLPLSLRVFYEVVGAVNLIGSHPSLAPERGTVCPDPLVVFGIDDVLEEVRERLEDEDGEGTSIAIAPDDLHKADTSGGDPYEIQLPNPGADAVLHNERHHLLFVDYLRLCFRFGGFPGYEGIDLGVPAEI